MDLPSVVADMAQNLGREFPAPPQEMVLRQLASLVEEAIELDEALEDGSQAEVCTELAQCIFSAYLVAHYMGDVGRSLDSAVLVSALSSRHEAPYRAAGRAMKAGRRYLGIARKRGGRGSVVIALADTVVASRMVAKLPQFEIDLETVLAEQAKKIFTRGWRASDPLYESS